MQDDRLGQSLANGVVRLFRLVNRAHNRALKPLGLSAEQAHVLSVLWVEGPMTIGRLQRLLALSSATLTGAIDRMEKSGLVRRVASPDDGRAWLIEPALGARERRRIEETIEAEERRCFAALTAAERRDLLRLLARSTEALEAE
jgi:DNA-binding MarR family transcriptional regulator